MRVAVFGAGAVGSILGAFLSRRARVTLIGRRSHVSAVRARGLALTGTTRGVFRIEATTQPSAAAEADLVILTTKSFDTPAAAAALSRAGVEAPVLTLQNGLTNVPALEARLHRNPIVAGSIILGAIFERPGLVRHEGGGHAVVGAARGPARHAREAARLLSASGVPTRVARDLDAVLWQKAIVNAAVNPLTAVLRCTNGEVLARPETALLAHLAADEATDVARAARIGVVRDAWPGIARILTETSGNRTSMLQDVEAGRRTEVDSITGEIVRVARRVRVPAPVNAALLRIVRGL